MILRKQVSIKWRQWGMNGGLKAWSTYRGFCLCKNRAKTHYYYFKLILTNVLYGVYTHNFLKFRNFSVSEELKNIHVIHEVMFYHWELLLLTDFSSLLLDLCFRETYLDGTWLGQGWKNKHRAKKSPLFHINCGNIFCR